MPGHARLVTTLCPYLWWEVRGDPAFIFLLTLTHGGLFPLGFMILACELILSEALSAHPKGQLPSTSSGTLWAPTHPQGKGFSTRSLFAMLGPRLGTGM